jgi:hypothetical protein
MRAVSVDAKGAYFMLKVFFLAFFGVVAYSSFTFIHNSLANSEDVANMISVIKNDNRSILKESDKYIDIDILGEKISLHDEGDIVGSFNIVSVPKNISFDKKSYTVDYKKRVENSTITMASFPKFVMFGGKYAIHGKPSYLNNDDIKSFIEVSNSDAKKIYDFAEASMPVFVYADKKDENKKENKKNIFYKDKPATSALSYALADIDTGEILISKNAQTDYPIASVTKLITALASSELVGANTEIFAPNGHRYNLGDLYYQLLLRSDNNVAKRIALHFGYSSFINEMNKYVRSVGMDNTSFKDSSGLSKSNVSNARDLVLLARHLYKEKKFVLDITKEDKITITSNDGFKLTLKNQNKLAGDPYFLGGKIGYTDEAGQTALSVFNVPVGDENHIVAVIILKSKDWKQDTRTLLKWYLQSYKDKV